MAGAVVSRNGDPAAPDGRMPEPCGATFTLSARRERDHRKSGQKPRCEECRSIRAPVTVTESMRRWWLDRYSLDEIRELVASLEGP